MLFFTGRHVFVFVLVLFFSSPVAFLLAIVPTPWPTGRFRTKTRQSGHSILLDSVSPALDNLRLFWNCIWKL